MQMVNRLVRMQTQCKIVRFMTNIAGTSTCRMPLWRDYIKPKQHILPGLC